MTEYENDFNYDFTWNHRILKKTYQFEGSLYEDFYIMEVHYKDGQPSSCCEPFISAESFDELQKVINQMQGAFSKPVLCMDDFEDQEPEEFED